MTLEYTDTFFCSQFPARISEGQLHSDQCLFLSTGFIDLLCGQWPDLFLVLHLLKCELWMNLRVHAVAQKVLQSLLLSRSASHWSGSFSSEYNSFCFSGLCSFAYTLRSLFGCMGHSSLCNNNSGPSNHSPFCILSIDALRLLKSASFLSVGQCLQTIPVSCGISAIFLTQLETKTFHAFLGLQIQYSATILSNHTFMEVIGNRFNAATRFFTIIFVAISPLTSSSLVIVVLYLEILDLEESSSLTMPVECLTTVTVVAEHAVLLPSTKTWSCTLFILLMSLTMLLGTLTFLRWLLHFSQSCLVALITSQFQPVFSSYSFL